MSSILKFIVLFLFTTTLIAGALYFDFDLILAKENKNLREQLAETNKILSYQKRFAADVEEIKDLIDSLDIPGQNLSYMNQLLNSKIVDVQKTIPVEDTTYTYDMYNNVINSYLEIKEHKTQLLEYSDADKRLKEYKKEVDRLKEELRETQKSLDIYKQN